MSLKDHYVLRLFFIFSCRTFLTSYKRLSQNYSTRCHCVPNRLCPCGFLPCLLAPNINESKYHQCLPLFRVIFSKMVPPFRNPKGYHKSKTTLFVCNGLARCSQMFQPKSTHAAPYGLREHCRISPPRFQADCHKRRLNQCSFVLLYFVLFVFSGLCLVFVVSVFNLSSVLYFPA